MSKIKKGLTRLTDLDAAEVSLVSEGANRRRFMIYKNAGEKMPQPHEELQKLVSHADPEVMKGIDGYLEKNYAIGKGAAEAPGAKEDPREEKDENAEGMEQSQPGERSMHHAALKAIARIAHAMKGKIPPHVVHGVLDETGFRMADDAGEDGLVEDENMHGASSTGHAPVHASAHGGLEPDEEDEVDKGFMAIPEEIEGIEKEHMGGAVEAAHGAYKEHLEKLGYQKYPEAQMRMKSKDGKAVMKEKGEHVAKTATPDLSTVDAETRQKLETVFKSNQELVKKNADLEARLKAGEEKARDKEIVAKAATFTHVALPQEDIVAQLKDADKLSKESFERVCKSFETLNEQAKTSRLFGEIGSALPGEGSSADNAWAKIEKAADGWVAKSGKDLSKAQAIDAFLKTPEGSKMYAEYKNGRKDGI